MSEQHKQEEIFQDAWIELLHDVYCAQKICTNDTY